MSGLLKLPRGWGPAAGLRQMECGFWSEETEEPSPGAGGGSYVVRISCIPLEGGQQCDVFSKKKGQDDEENLKRRESLLKAGN